MKVKAYPIQIWLLDEDLQKSAQMLSDKHLDRTIHGCVQALLATRYYFIGIRSKKFYDYYFSDILRDETMDRFFPLWYDKKKPAFQQYNSRISKWTRMCKEHYDFVLKYMRVLLDEHEFRKVRPHPLERFYEWETIDAPKLKILEAHIRKIFFEWKCLNPKYRSKDICQGYRNQYKAIMTNQGVKPDDYSRRDIPEFLLEVSKIDRSNISNFMI